MHILMIKRCLTTGLMYLCKTSSKWKNPYTYVGSGKRWLNHIKAHQSWIITCIIGEYDTKEELQQWGEYYSSQFDIVNSSNWANLTPERGNGGLIGTGQLGKTWKIKDTSKMSDAKNMLYASSEWQQNKDVVYDKNRGKHNYQFKGNIVTPWGVFESLTDCAIQSKKMRIKNPNAVVISDIKTIKKYIYNLDILLPIDGRRTPILWRGKTPRDIGFNFIKKEE